MHEHIAKLAYIADKENKVIIGLMSGTSLDGLDVALCDIAGHGQKTRITLKKFTTTPYTDKFRKQIRSIFSKRMVNLEKLTLMHPFIAEVHADMILKVLKEWKYAPNDVDLIASHGQSIYHAPKSLHNKKGFSNATLQIGDGDHLACRTGIITISDFRQKHIAAGGEGAPLASYVDHLIFGSRNNEDRIMLNIGGIANFTFLSGEGSSKPIYCTDVGPGNTMMDTYVQKHFTGLSFDKNAAIAYKGTVNEELLSALKDHEFFRQKFPKTTGPELFNLSYLESALKKTSNFSIAKEDVMATLNKFTSDSIVSALKTLATDLSVTPIYVSGGGMHNPLLIENIKKQIPGIVLKSTAELGVDPDAKEAVLFAVLANECISGSKMSAGLNRSGMPDITMGKISFPD